MKLREELLILIAFCSVAVLAGFWNMFRSSTHQAGSLGAVVEYRFFGRVTRVDMTPRGDSSPTDRFVYTWSEPFENGDPLTSCAAIALEHWQDRNRDGRWDTWLRRVGPDTFGECQVLYEIDTTGRGTPDWSFTLPYGQWRHADDLIQKRRGF